tara:strand:+ start:356 stop:667 length:312 start_codon:yes stop_codon:yes gene_type:complete
MCQKKNINFSTLQIYMPKKNIIFCLENLCAKKKILIFYLTNLHAKKKYYFAVLKIYVPKKIFFNKNVISIVANKMTADFKKFLIQGNTSYIKNFLKYICYKKK